MEIFVQIVWLLVLMAGAGYFGFLHGLRLGRKEGFSEGKVWGALESMIEFQKRGSIERKD